MRVYHWNGRLVLEGDNEVEREFIHRLLLLFKETTISTCSFGENPAFPSDEENINFISGSKDSA